LGRMKPISKSKPFPHQKKLEGGPDFERQSAEKGKEGTSFAPVGSKDQGEASTGRRERKSRAKEGKKRGLRRPRKIREKRLMKDTR